MEPVGPITVWIAGMRGVSARGLQVDSTSSAMGAALCHGVAHIIEHNHIQQPPEGRKAVNLTDALREICQAAKEAASKAFDALRKALIPDITDEVSAMLDDLRRIVAACRARAEARRESTGRAEKDAPRTDRAARGLAGFATSAAMRKSTAATGQ